MKRALATVAALFLAACGSSKEPAYFAIASTHAAARAGAPPLVEIRRPSIPGYLDRPDVVKKVADYRLKVDTDERWAEPLGDMIGRVLADDLAGRLTGSQVFIENGAIAAVPDVIVSIDVAHFDADADGTVNLVAVIALEVKNDPTASRVQRFERHTKPSGSDTAALVATMSTLLADLADATATLLGAR